MLPPSRNIIVVDRNHFLTKLPSVPQNEMAIVPILIPTQTATPMIPIRIYGKHRKGSRIPAPNIAPASRRHIFTLSPKIIPVIKSTNKSSIKLIKNMTSMYITILKLYLRIFLIMLRAFFTSPTSFSESICLIMHEKSRNSEFPFAKSNKKIPIQIAHMLCSLYRLIFL